MEEDSLELGESDRSRSTLGRTGGFETFRYRLFPRRFTFFMFFQRKKNHRKKISATEFNLVLPSSFWKGRKEGDEERRRGGDVERSEEEVTNEIGIF